MMRIAFLACLTAASVAIAGCGVDGEPLRPSLNAGIGIDAGGVHVGGNVGARKGPVSIAIGL